MTRIKVVHSFQDIHTGQVYEADQVIEVTAERLAEINKNLPGFVVPAGADEVEKPKKKTSRKATVADDDVAE